MTDHDVPAAIEPPGDASAPSVPDPSDELQSKSAATPGDVRVEPSLPDVIVDQLLVVVELTHDERGMAYATLSWGGRPETVRIRSPKFRRFVIREVHRVHGRTVSASVIDTVISTLDAIAVDYPEVPVHLRVGTLDDQLVVDLGDASGSCVSVTDLSWCERDRSPIRFVRPDTLGALPNPKRGGSIHDLRSFVSLSDDDFLLLIGWLLAALRPNRPCPVLVLTGNQGSGKSSLTRIVRLLVDPNSVPLRAVPKSEEHLLISAMHARVIALENVSAISGEMSDALCRLVTGGGLTKRTLYSDEGETTFGAMRAIVVNGIGSIITRPDLAERSLVLVARRMSERDRRTEAALWEDFESVRPRIFGCLLDGLVTAQARHRSVVLTETPRMADFAAWIAAGASGLGIDGRAMLRAYTRNRERAVQTALDASPVASALRTLLARNEVGVPWEGTPQQLHDALRMIVGEDVARSGFWPRLANHFTAQLRRDDTFLRSIGIEVSFSYRGHMRWMMVRATRSFVAASEASVDWIDGDGPIDADDTDDAV